MRDPATIGLLAAAPVVDVSLEPFGEAAVSPILAVIAGAATDHHHIARLLTQLTRIVKKHELTTESRGAVTEAVQGFLGGETLRAMQVTDPRGNVLSSAVDLAVALDDSVSLAMIRGIASDPAEAVRAGVAPGNATRIVSEVRRKIAWTPPARSQAEITADLKTVTRSARETLAQIEAATLAARVAMIAALKHLNSVPVDEESWSTSLVVELQSSLVYAVGRLEDQRAIPALARSGWGFTCTTSMVGDISVEIGRETLIAIAREILAAIAEPGAPPRRVSAGLYDVAVLLMGNDLTRDIPDELVEEIVARARGYLDGSTMGGFATARPHHRFRIVRNAILLAAVIDDPGLVALVEGLSAGPEALAALGVTDAADVETILRYAPNTLAGRPFLALGDC